MPMSKRLKADSDLSKAALNKAQKKDSVLQNALSNYEYHQKRKKRKNKNDKVEDMDNFSI